MAGSNDYVFKIGAVGVEAVIAGQLEGSMTLNGAPVEITNKASGGYIEYLPDFVAGKQVSFAVTFRATDDVAQNTVKAAIEAGTQVAGNIISSATGAVVATAAKPSKTQKTLSAALGIASIAANFIPGAGPAVSARIGAVADATAQ